MTTQEQTHNQGERVYQARIGKRPIALPKGVTASVKGRSVEIKGPKGTLTRELPPNVNLKADAGSLLITAAI
jgi:large subunit ribosomal protein L6